MDFYKNPLHGNLILLTINLQIICFCLNALSPLLEKFI